MVATASVTKAVAVKISLATNGVSPERVHVPAAVTEVVKGSGIPSL